MSWVVWIDCEWYGMMGIRPAANDKPNRCCKRFTKYIMLADYMSNASRTRISKYINVCLPYCMDISNVIERTSVRSLFSFIWRFLFNQSQWQGWLLLHLQWMNKYLTKRSWTLIITLGVGLFPFWFMHYLSQLIIWKYETPVSQNRFIMIDKQNKQKIETKKRHKEHHNTCKYIWGYDSSPDIRFKIPAYTLHPHLYRINTTNVRVKSHNSDN